MESGPESFYRSEYDRRNKIYMKKITIDKPFKIIKDVKSE